MNNQKENIKVVPELRFGEFDGDGEWMVIQLGDKTSKVGSGKTPRGGSKNYKTKGRPFVRSQNIGWGILLLDDVVYIDEKTHRTFLGSEIRIDDVLLNITGASIGRSAIASSVLAGGNVNQHVCIIRAKKKKLNPVFLNQFIISHNCQNQIDSYQAGGNREGLNFSQIRSLKIPSPPSPLEQQKIAHTLSTLDELIAAEQEKRDALAAHKKGLLQQLFPAKGEKVPKLRFGEFEGEWEEKRVDEYFDVGSSKRVLRKDWTDKGVPFYRTRELVSLSKNEPFGSEIFISEELFLELSKKYAVPKEGDFLISGVGTLGISYQVKAKDKFYFKDGNVIWFKREKGIVSDYFNFCFQSNHFQNQIFGQSSASTVGTYTIKNAKKTKFWMPPTKEEQQKIAHCLSSLDEWIAAQSEKIDALKEHKKGLMQGLFP